MDKVMSDGLGGAGHGGIEGFSKLDHLRMGDGICSERRLRRRNWGRKVTCTHVLFLSVQPLTSSASSDMAHFLHTLTIVSSKPKVDESLTPYLQDNSQVCSLAFPNPKA